MYNDTVTQKTVQVFTCFWKIVLVQNADIIQGPDFWSQKIEHISFQKKFRLCTVAQKTVPMFGHFV